MDNVTKLHAAWCRSLQQAMDLDEWGQVLEAVEAYERLAGRLEKALPACQCLTDAQKEVLGQVGGALAMRAKCLSAVEQRRRLRKEDMADVFQALRGALSDEPVNFSRHSNRALRLNSRAKLDQKDEKDEVLANFGTEVGNGATYLDLQILQIGLKDATIYVNPTIAVSIVDYSGKLMEEVQETGRGACTEPPYVTFTTTIPVATNMRKMEDHGAAVVFEFYHYKAKKRKRSCRCWALLELEEMKPGHKVLELYQKPMDPTRKRIYLFTEKELYLHLELRLQTR